MKIIKFNAVWCPACLVQKTIWKNLKDELKDVNIVEYDYDLDDDKVIEYNVGNVLPVIIKEDENGNEKARLIGEKTKEEIISFIRK